MKSPFQLNGRPSVRELGLVALLAAGLVLGAWFSAAGRWTEQFSFDVISVALRNAPPPDVVLVYLDERSHDLLQQPYDRPWDRRLHAQLVERLRETGARLVFFDIVFGKDAPDPLADLAFAEAIRAHGNVILGGSIADAQDPESVQRRIIAPVPVLRTAARGWGSLFFLLDSDTGVRRILEQVEGVPHSAVVTAQILGTPPGPVSDNSKWIRYLGPPGTFQAVSYHQAIIADGVPAGYFANKVVLIGVKYSTGFSGSGKDTFATPYSRFGSAAMDGVEVNANLLSTLRTNNALRRLSPASELLLLVITSVGLACIVIGLQPVAASLVTLGCAFTSCFVGLSAANWGHYWGDWFLFAGGAAPVALVLSIGRNYYFEHSRREQVTQAFEKYLSPEIVRQVISSPVDLRPGGATRRVTAVMTDIEGFASFAEGMTAEEVGRMLVAYFTQLTQHVFDQKGTVVQFVGDAAYCVWGAPLDQPAQADLALRAALAIQASMREMSFEGRPLKTRIGISTGPGLCGNLGSRDRFDYAVIGDNTNMAARIEGANKKLGTRVLVAESTKRALQGSWVLRDVGDFLVAGRLLPVRLWELIAEGPVMPDGWRETLPVFAKGIAAFRSANWTDAEVHFKTVLQLRAAEGDGPSEFYLKHIQERVSRPSFTPIAL